MKKKYILSFFASIAMLTTSTMFLTGCSAFTKKDNTPKEYIIQYTDDVGVHTLNVTDGMPYSLDVVPIKKGYEFVGLFDAEVGGTQYVSSSGSSLAPYSDKKNLVLFPQYKALDYTVILDYQGAAVTGSRQFTVPYGSSIPELPKNLIVNHKEFAGWYTEENCGGVQVADQYGLIPLVSIVNEQNFDTGRSSITLYAGFKAEMHTITFCFETGMKTEEVEVAYNTPISQVVPKTRVDGKAVLTWSKTQDGSVWIGEVTDDMVLYAVEYAPVIDFDINGGNQIIPIVARAGETIALPTPAKDLAKFSHWEDMEGNIYTETTMPEESITLKAIWQAKLVFDENGGSDVNDISEKVGTSITLPNPERENFIFAGWYTSEKEQYTSTTMPAAGIALKAGWYKAKKETIVIVAQNSIYDPSGSTNDEFVADKLAVNMSSIFDASFSGRISIKANMKLKFTGKDYTNTPYIRLNYYSQNTASSSYLLHSETITATSSSYKDISFVMNFEMRGNMIYCSRFCNYNPSNYIIADYYMDISYPDVTNLYL